jgi:hypothetical protein
MTTQHTPGPWKAQGWNDLVVNSANGDTILACPGSSSGGIDEMQANARLIAAAPELLTALEWALEQLEDDLDPDYQLAFDAAMATVQKATVIQ